MPGTRSIELLTRLVDEGPSLALWRDLLDALLDVFRAERIFLVKLRRGGGFRVLAARSHDREDLRDAESKVSHFAVHRMAESGDPIHVADARKDRRYRTEEALHGRHMAQSILVLPLASRGRLHGGIYADHRFQAIEPPRHEEAELRVLTGIASLCLAPGERRVTFEPASVPEPRPTGGARGEGPEATPAEREGLQLLAPESLKVEAFEGLVSANPDMKDLFDSARSLAQANLPILIRGETGTGKGALARAIHAASPRSAGPFVTISCAAIPEDLIESEILGHVRGAFTGAEGDRAGVLVEAHGGTLHLDEVGDMSPAFQRKLLRVIEDGRVRPLGAKQAIQVDVRLIASTSADLGELVRAGSFRRDLYFRLKSAELEIPPLRDRKEDILAGARVFLEREAGARGRSPQRLGRDASLRLLRHSWPGNVRELENEMRRLVAVAPEVIEAGDLLLGKEIEAVGGEVALSGGAASLRLSAQVEAAERAAVKRALKAARGNKSRAAKALGITRKSLYRRIERYGLHPGENEVRPE